VALAGFSMSRLTATAPQRTAEALRRVVELLATGQLDMPVTEVASLADVPAVHQLLADGRGSGKYVVILTS
jgi:NADPH2:quinone reductase